MFSIVKITEGNLVLSTELVAKIGLSKEFKSWRFERKSFLNRSDGGLTLETSAFKLYTVANLHYQLSW